MSCNKQVPIDQNPNGKPTNPNNISPTMLIPSAGDGHQNIGVPRADDKPCYGGVWLGNEIYYHRNGKN
jgi:hypothetical protein